jgi:hypothetical protein
VIRLVQLQHPQQGRCVALVEEPRLHLLKNFDSIYRLAQAALAGRQPLEQAARGALGGEAIEYDPVYRGDSDWHLLPAFDHPEEPGRCLVSGTGLTHRKSAESRSAMHGGQQPATVTDSMRMYQAGLEGGRPAPGKIGSTPEWFYKGCGTVLRAHGQPLEVPAFGLDGGEESEVAGIYLVDAAGSPRRVGLAQGNEFSDHKMERQGYLHLALSKLRTCALGPELVVSGDFNEAGGTVRILRDGTIAWSQPFATGEKNMSHSIANLEHHHFKYPAHRRPGDAHVHFFGADAFSFSFGIELAEGDVMEIELNGFGRPLRNPIHIDRSAPELVSVAPL